MRGTRWAVALIGVLGACRGGVEPIGTVPSFQRILVLGNSITLHGPDPSIGWPGDWGMAASGESADFAHLLAAKIPSAALEARNVSGLETDPSRFDVHSIDSSLARKPDLVVLELGDNARDATAFSGAYSGLVRHVAEQTGVTMVCVTTWWSSAEMDRGIRAACTPAGARIADIGAIYAVRANRAGSERSFPDPGVAIHPGDEGMRNIAEVIVRAVAR